MATVGLLRTNPNPSEQDVARLLDGNVCRCGTYPRIVRAVRLAAERVRNTTATAGASAMSARGLAVDALDVERYELERAARGTRSSSSGAISSGSSAPGSLVLVAAPTFAGQESGRPARGRDDVPDLAAWLHIDESGHVTACTGKVEIGQNIRTSLSQTVADELRVPLASVTMVMGDTDRTPFDMGTFGSLTTPRMAPQLARAAATAREMLIDLAAARWQLTRSGLVGARRPCPRARRPIALVR